MKKTPDLLKSLLTSSQKSQAIHLLYVFFLNNTFLFE